MAPSDRPDGGETKGGDDEKVNKRDVAEFLQAPRKKRKSFVLMACGRNVAADLRSGIDSFVKTNFKAVAVAHPRTVEELTKQFNRQIVLMIYDDEFTDLEEGLQMIRDLKKKKTGAAVVPVLFLTRHPEKLVEHYNKLLLPFHEADEYIMYQKVVPAYIFSKIRAGLTNKNRRRSRRYKVDVPIQYFLLADDRLYPGQLQDLSIHGALIRTEENRIFRPGDQLKVHLPISEYLPPDEGDFLKVSARVRRVFISGNLAGVSFEYLSDRQLLVLTKYLTEMVNLQNQRKTSAMRAARVMARG